MVKVFLYMEMFTFTKKVFLQAYLSIPNLGTQVRCAQNVPIMYSSRNQKYFMFGS